MVSSPGLSALPSPVLVGSLSPRNRMPSTSTGLLSSTVKPFLRIASSTCPPASWLPATATTLRSLKCWRSELMLNTSQDCPDEVSSPASISSLRAGHLRHLGGEARRCRCCRAGPTTRIATVCSSLGWWICGGDVRDPVLQLDRRTRSTSGTSRPRTDHADPAGGGEPGRDLDRLAAGRRRTAPAAA